MDNLNFERKYALRSEDIEYIRNHVSAPRSDGPGHLEIVGAPLIGKSTILELVDEAAKRGSILRANYCTVLLPWPRATGGYLFISIVKGIRRTWLKEVEDVTGQLVEQSLSQFFDKLVSQQPDKTVVFLLDDFDVALDQSRGHSAEAKIVRPEELLGLADKWPNNVRLVITSGESLSWRGYGRWFGDPYWLKLPSKKELKKYLGYLELEPPQNPETLIQWAGPHPFLLTTLYEKGADSSGLARWRKDADVQKFLSDTYEYLESNKPPDLRVVVQRLLRKELRNTPGEQDLVLYLRNRGVVDIDKEIPSRLVREYLEERLGLASLLKKLWKWFWAFDGVRLFQMSYIAIILSSGSAFVLIRIGKDPQFALLWTLAPVTYGLWGVVRGIISIILALTVYRLWDWALYAWRTIKQRVWHASTTKGSIQSGSSEV